MNRMIAVIALALVGLCGCRPADEVASSPSGTGSLRTDQTASTAPATIITRHEPDAVSPASILPAEIPADLTPEAVCEKFLDLLSRSEVTDAERLLSKRSAVVTRQARLSLAAPAGGNARFQIEPAQYADNKQKRAMVLCRLLDTEPGTAETAHSGDAISWMLRRDSEGWRITGLVLLDDDLPINLLSFENPSDVDAIRELLGGQQATALQPGGTVQR